MIGPTPTAPFGRLLSAMVTPFHPDGSLDLDGAVALARHLVDEAGHDGLVISGTGGESPTTSDAEKRDLLAAVVATVGDRATVVAGVGTFDTRHSVELAETAAVTGADGLLLVSPYYSRPPQAGLLAHFRAVADATELPVMLYDIPVRTGVAIETSTLLALAEHERMVAVKDSKNDLAASAAVMAATDLAYYSGEDALTLPLLSLGAVGLVGTSTHFCGSVAAELITAFVDGDPATALTLHRRLLPVFTGVFAVPGTVMVKAALRRRGRDVGPVRSPLVDADPAVVDTFLDALDRAGL